MIISRPALWLVFYFIPFSKTVSMKLFLFVALILCFVSCSEKSATGKQLTGSDSLVINFNEPQTNNIAKTVTTTENKAIEKLAGFVDGKTSEAYKCGYDGNLLFYKKGKIAALVNISLLKYEFVNQVVRRWLSPFYTRY